MKHALLVARHEFIQTITQPAFYISIMIFFGALLLGATLPRFIEESLRKTTDISIVDLSGGHFEGMEQALTRQSAHRDLAEINYFVRENLKPEFEQAPPALYEKSGRMLSEDDISAFRLKGRDAYLQDAMAYVVDDAISPSAPHQRFSIHDRTTEFQKGSGDASAKATQLLNAQSESAPDKRVIIFIPEEFNLAAPQRAPVSIWSLETLGPDFAAGLRNDIDDFIAYESARQKGELETINRFEAAYGDVRFHALDQEFDDEGLREIEFIPWLVEKMPVGLLLLVVILVTTQSVMLLTNTIEEKSNRIVEVMLSSMSPQQFMMGKLLGPMMITIFVGLIMSLGSTAAMMIFTAATGPDTTQAAAALSTQGGNEILSDVVEPLLSGLLPKIPGAFLYFVLAYLTFAGIFLAIGALCTELRQVQSVAAPLNLTLFGLGGLSVIAALAPEENLAHILSWIPLTSPFVMIGRLGSDVALWEYVGTVILQCAVIYLLLRTSGRVFKQAALRSGGLPSLRELRHMMAGRH